MSELNTVSMPEIAPKKKRGRPRKEPKAPEFVAIPESTMDQPPTTITLKNTREQIGDIGIQHEFFLGIKAIQDKFYREIRAYGDQHKIEINTSVQFELIK